LAFLDPSSLRTHFWPLPFPSENFGGHGKKVTGDGRPRGSAFAGASACVQRLRRDKTAWQPGGVVAAQGQRCRNNLF